MALFHPYFWGFSGEWLRLGKNLSAKQDTQVRFLGWKEPWRRKWRPTLVFLPGKFHGQRSQGHKRVRHNIAAKQHQHPISKAGSKRALWVCWSWEVDSGMARQQMGHTSWPAHCPSLLTSRSRFTVPLNVDLLPSWGEPVFRLPVISQELTSTSLNKNVFKKENCPKQEPNPRKCCKKKGIFPLTLIHPFYLNQGGFTETRARSERGRQALERISPESSGMWARSRRCSHNHQAWVWGCVCVC